MYVCLLLSQSIHPFYTLAYLSLGIHWVKGRVHPGEVTSLSQG